MAVRCDAAGDYLSRTTSLPNADVWTACGWMKLSTDLNANSQCLISLGSGTANHHTLRCVADGTGMRVQWRSAATSITAGSLSLVSMTVGTWYFLAYTINAAAIVGYHGIASSPTLSTASATASGGSTWFTPTSIQVGRDHLASTTTDAVICAVKVWQAVLTLEELQAERWVIRPQRTANLHCWHPFFTGDRTTDFSGNGRTLTENGTLTDEDPAPISWGGRSTRFISYSPAVSNIVLYRRIIEGDR